MKSKKNKSEALKIGSRKPQLGMCWKAVVHAVHGLFCWQINEYSRRFTTEKEK